MTDIYFQGFWRMDWGLGNPNKTAALIAILIIAVWGFAYIRKWGFWLAVVLFTAMGICLIHTFSRGGLIAAAAGLAILAWQAPRPWKKRRMIALGISAWAIIGFSVFVQAHERYGQGVVKEDRSITNRVALWKSAPAMMADAPGGWGIGQSGISYVRWYQPVERSEPYRTFVNSHLTWLVELGWIGRFLYLAGWGWILLLCWPTKNAQALAIPLAVWISFAVSAVFSSVAESPWLWIIPVLTLIFAIAFRFRRNLWPKATLFALPAGFALALCFLLFFIGRTMNSPVKKQGEVVVFGAGTPEYLVLIDTSVLGQNYHRILRQCAEKANLPTIGMTEAPSSLMGREDMKIVLAGINGTSSIEALRDVFAGKNQVMVVNPKLLPEQIGLLAGQGNRVEVIFGEFAQAGTLPNWSKVASVKKIPAIGDFLPDWPMNLFQMQSGTNE